MSDALPLPPERHNLGRADIVLGDSSVRPLQINAKHSHWDAQVWPRAIPFAVHDAVGDLEVGRLSTELFSHTLPSTAKGESPFIIHVRKLPKTAQCESIGNATLTVAGAE